MQCRRMFMSDGLLPSRCFVDRLEWHGDLDQLLLVRSRSVGEVRGRGCRVEHFVPSLRWIGRPREQVIEIVVDTRRAEVRFLAERPTQVTRCTLGAWR